MSEGINLNTVANGALQEKFNHEHQKVIENISDLNTDAQKKREIIIKLTYNPGKKRDQSNVSISVSSKLQPHEAQETTILFGQDSQGDFVSNELKSGMQGQNYMDVDTGEVKDDIGNTISEPKGSEMEQSDNVVDWRKASK
ncbi:hypothetical protein [Listeria fleischmannii]|uniref:Uncharacterized protein n=1 Tax=Listeria fleischmannii FSL S10-1203 TaxID=1265822 RepID=W7CS56_9LIST|nr:hypothetical protein [Listeria fleischmannii]EUJ42479.1 hypothetical protein MCOL2_20972 [Listeria fleischmannii FSL S10-1203]